MTAQYRAVSSLLVDDPEFQKLDPYTRWVYVVLTVTLGPSGIEAHYPDALLHELRARAGGTVKQVAAALTKLEAAGWIEREGRLVWAVRLLDLDPHMHPDNDKHVRSITGHVDALPDCDLTDRFREFYDEWFPLAGSPGSAMPAGTGRVSVPKARATDRLSEPNAEPSRSPSTEKGNGKKEKGNGVKRRERENPGSVGTGSADASRPVLTAKDKTSHTRELVKPGSPLDSHVLEIIRARERDAPPF